MNIHREMRERRCYKFKLDSSSIRQESGTLPFVWGHSNNG